MQKALKEQSVRFRALFRRSTDAQTLTAIEGHCDDLDHRVAGPKCGASSAANSTSRATSRPGTFQTDLTGHPGGLSTIHANSADDVLRRVEDLIAEVSTRTPRRAIAQAVDRIVHIRRTATGRKVEAVLGVEPSGDDAYAISLLA